MTLIQHEIGTMKKFFLLSVFFLIASVAWANSQPASLILYENPAATVLLVDKSECSVNVYQFQKRWEKIQQVNCDVGKMPGDKFREGDLKTPTGFYRLSRAWTGETLQKQYGRSAKIYGAGAFALNYPNYLDKTFYRKTGYGIWLHGTDKEQPEATRGCIATSNADLLQLAQFIELKQTPFIVEEKITYVPAEEVSKIREELVRFVEQWRSSWESKNTKKYLSFYSKKFKTRNKNYSQWKHHKYRVNRRNKNRKIQVSDLSIFKAKGVYNVQFVQKYFSSRTKSTGRKHLYIVKEEGQYRILSEQWQKLSPPPPPSPLQYAYKAQGKAFF